MVFKAKVWDENENYLKGVVVEFPGNSGTYFIKNQTTDDSVLGTPPPSAGADFIPYDPSNPDHPKMNPFDSAGNYPGAIALHENRLILGGTDNYPLTVWGSSSKDMTVFLLGANADDPWEYEFNSISGDRINWIASAGNLIVGTAGGEWRIGGGDYGIIPGQISIKKQSNHGSNNLQGILVGSSLMFWQRAGERLKNYIWQSEEEAFRASDLTAISSHITQSGIVDMALQMDPMPILWMIRADGVLIGATFDFNTGSVGWHRHPAAGNAKAVSVSVSPTDTFDRVWVVYERTLTAGVKEYIEYFDYIDPWRDQQDYHFVGVRGCKKRRN